MALRPAEAVSVNSTPEEREQRASWLGVNAYGVFIAVLALLIAVRYAMGASWEGERHVLADAGHLLYGLAGLGLLWSYWKQRVDLEVFASVALLLGNFTLLGVRALGVIELAPFTVYQALVSVGLAVAVTARLAALMKGGEFTLPRWRKK